MFLSLSAMWALSLKISIIGFCFKLLKYHNVSQTCSTYVMAIFVSFLVELTCSLMTGLFSMPLGILQFLPIYHPLHDNLHIHTEVCVLLILTLYALIVWSSDRNPTKEARPESNRGNRHQKYVRKCLYL